MTVRNLLFIMADQLRWDHLSCYGHPYLDTPNIDALARRGVLFDRAFVQSGVCGPSRMSYYTGRYVASHGATWNRVPLSVGEWTLGDYLRQSGRELALAGKTHVIPDQAGLARFGLEGESELGALLARGGFVEVDRHDGHHAEPRSDYAEFLRNQGYDSPDPWTDFVIGALDEKGAVVSGWHMRNAHLPARVAEEHSETAYNTSQAIRYIEQQGDKPWALHLSYVKPHWPYMAPAPYHAMYDASDCLPVKRDPRELENPHPALAAYRLQEECRNFMRDEVIARVRPTYQGLIRQLDDHLGRVWQALERLGRWQDTLIVFTSDHGDYLGDHWLGEKELFHDTAQRVPYLLYDPSQSADVTRGTRCRKMIEAIDTVPTCLEALGLPPEAHRVEGRSLLAMTRQGEMKSVEKWRDAVFSELDYSYREARLNLRRAPDACIARMVRTEKWKYVDWLDLPPQLFDLESDPDEYCDLGRSSGLEDIKNEMSGRLADWLARRKRRTTVTLAQVEAGTAAHRKAGVFYGQW